MNKSVLIPGMLCAGFAAASGYLWQEMRTQRDRADALQNQVAALRSVQKARSIPAPPPAAAAITLSAPAGPEVATMTAQTTPSSPAAANALSRNRFFDPFQQQQRLLKDPEYRQLMLAQQRMSMARMHPDLMAALGLSREQTDRLYDLLAQQQMRSMENRPSIRPVNGAPDEAAMQDIQHIAQQEQRSNETELAALLGATKLAEWKDYQQSMGARFQVNQLRDVLAGGDAALRQDQVQPLVAAIAQEQRRVITDNGYGMLRPTQTMTAEDRTRMMEEAIEHTSASNQRIHDAALAILSSDQLESLDELLSQNLNMQRMGVRMMRARAEAEARGEVPPTGSMDVVASQAVPIGR